MADAHANFAYSTVSVAPVPATSGLALTVAGGTWPATPFNATVHAASATEAQIASGAEIIRVTANAAGVFTITRANEGPNAARTIVTGDVVKAGATAKTLTDVETAIPAFATPAIVLGSAAAAGAAATVVRSDGTIAAFDATNPTTQAFADAAAVGAAAFAARRDHKHAMPANPVGTSWTTVRKASDESVASSTTLQNDDELFFTAASGTAYEVLLFLIYVSTAGGGTPDFKASVGEDTATRGVAAHQGVNSGDTATLLTAVTSTAAAGTWGTATTNRVVMIRAFHVGAGGSFILQWAQGTSGINATVLKAGSVLWYRAIT